MCRARNRIVQPARHLLKKIGREKAIKYKEGMLCRYIITTLPRNIQLTTSKREQMWYIEQDLQPTHNNCHVTLHMWSCDRKIDHVIRQEGLESSALGQGVRSREQCVESIVQTWKGTCSFLTVSELQPFIIDNLILG